MILQLSSYHLSGGAGVAATRLHRALSKHGITSRLLVDNLSVEEQGVGAISATPWQKKMYWARFIAERLYFLPHERDRSVRFAFSPARVGLDLHHHSWVKEASVIHLNWINFGFLSLDSLEKLLELGKPVVWTLHDMWSFTGGCHYSRGCVKYETHCQHCSFLRKPAEYDLSFQVFEQKRQMLKRFPVTYVCPSTWLTELTQSSALAGDARVVTIPYAIDTTVFRPVDQQAVRTRLGLPPDKKLILFGSANIRDPRKGFRYLKEALELIPPTAGVEIVTFGKSAADAFAGLAVPFHNLGVLNTEEKIVEAYNAADVMVVPSLEDNLPNTVMEAMACGTPVVGFRTGGIPDMIDHLVNGFVADFQSSRSLAEGLRWALENRTTGALSNLAREKVLRSYSEEIVAGRYRALYESLLTPDTVL